MKREVLGWLGILVAVGLARGELVCSMPTHQAGEVRSGVALQHHFVLVNKGSQPVEILDLKTRCGCLKPTVDLRTLSPGSAARVLVQVNTVTQAGISSWPITVRYREGTTLAELPLCITAQLVPDLTIQPATLVLHATMALTHTLTLTERRTVPVQVRSAVCSSPHVQVRPEKPVRADDVWQRTITLSVQPGHPEGRHEHVLCLHTDDASCPELKVGFAVVKRNIGTVRASPAALDWQAPDRSELPSRIVLLGTGDETAVGVERVEVGHPCLRCTHADAPHPRATLRLQVDAEKLPATGLESSVRVHLRQPAGQVLVIPVRVKR